MKIGVRHCLPDIFGNLIFFIQKRIQFQREVYSTIPKIGSYGYLDEVAFVEVPPFFVEMLYQFLNNNINDIFKFHALLISL